MRTSRWTTIAIALVLIACCFFPWVVIESKNIVITGIHAEGTNYGKPGYLNIMLTSIIIVLAMFAKIWSQRISIFVAAFNIGWALRNFIMLGACEAGECPVRKPAFIVYSICSVLLMLSVLFQKIDLPPAKEDAAA
jgi:hypothetical protein